MVVIRRVVGASMLPTLQPGRVVFGLRFPRRLSPGDVVIVRHDGLEKIKRVAHINDAQIFVVGDNPASSTDSRNFGPLPRSAIVAKIIWPKTKVTDVR